MRVWTWAGVVLSVGLLLGGPAAAATCGAEISETFIRSAPDTTETFQGDLASVTISPERIEWAAAPGVEVSVVTVTTFPAETERDDVEIGGAMQMRKVDGDAGVLDWGGARVVSVDGVRSCPEPAPTEVADQSPSEPVDPPNPDHPLRDLLVAILDQAGRLEWGPIRVAAL